MCYSIVSDVLLKCYRTFVSVPGKENNVLAYANGTGFVSSGYRVQHLCPSLSLSLDGACVFPVEARIPAGGVILMRFGLRDEVKWVYPHG